MRVTRPRTARGVWLALLAAVSAAAAALPAAASAAPGDLTYQGCITGEEATGPDGSGACAAIPEATPTGDDSGLDRLESVAVSPDGHSVYVAAGQLDHAVAHFNRDPATGALTYVGCMTGEALNTGCTPIAGATMTGDNSGLNWPESVAVSPDGLSGYLTSRFDSAIAQFSRDPTTGALDYIGCDSSEDESVPPCDAIATPTTGGADSGFHDPKHKAAVFSADGRFVYAAGEQDHSIVVFDRDTATGALSFDSCLTGETESIPPCTDTGTATSGGDASGLQQPRWLLMGPDDVSLYAVANNDDAIARFSRDPTTGSLDFEGCITGDTATGSGGSGACDEIPGATPNAIDSGLDDPRAMVALWMIGLEDEPERSSEICVAEIFGRTVGPDSARIGMGVHPFGDPAIADVPHPGERIPRGRPICTVFASGRNAGACLRALGSKAGAIYRAAEPGARGAA